MGSLSPPPDGLYLSPLPPADDEALLLRSRGGGAAAPADGDVRRSDGESQPPSGRHHPQRLQTGETETLDITSVSHCSLSHCSVSHSSVLTRVLRPLTLFISASDRGARSAVSQ